MAFLISESCPSTSSHGHSRTSLPCHMLHLPHHQTCCWMIPIRRQKYVITSILDTQTNPLFPPASHCPISLCSLAVKLVLEYVLRLFSQLPHCPLAHRTPAVWCLALPLHWNRPPRTSPVPSQGDTFMFSTSRQHSDEMTPPFLEGLALMASAI